MSCIDWGEPKPFYVWELAATDLSGYETFYTGLYATEELAVEAMEIEKEESPGCLYTITKVRVCTASTFDETSVEIDDEEEPEFDGIPRPDPNAGEIRLLPLDEFQGEKGIEAVAEAIRTLLEGCKK